MLEHNDIQYFIHSQVNGKDAHRAKRVLVTDDNEANRLIAKTILEREGYEVHLAIDGQDAVNAVKTTTFDIILMDILMPVMDGIKALRRIHSLAPDVKTPLVFAITAFCSPADQHRYSLAGFDAVLKKPLRYGDVKLALKQSSSSPMTAPVKIVKSEAAPFETIEILDTVIINQLCFAADRDTLTTIQEKFWKDVRMNSQTIKTVLPAALNAMPNALTDMRKAVHTIKGASASIGLRRVSHIARQLQNAPPDKIATLLHALFKNLIASKAPLNMALQQKSLANPNFAVAPLSGVNART